MSKDQRALRNRIIVSALERGMNPKETSRHVGLSTARIYEVYHESTGHGYHKPSWCKYNRKFQKQLKRVRELLTLFPNMVFEPFDEPGWDGFGMIVIE